MRIAALIATSVLLAAPMSFAQTVDHSQAPAMLGWINAARAQHGAAALTEDPRLDTLAEEHSMDMATHHYFDHVSPTEGSPSQRATAAGINYHAWAENIALDRSPRAAFDALMHSPGHYANLMNPSLHAVGLGMVNTSDGVYVTQSFADLDEAAQPMVTPVPGVSITPIPPPAAPAAPAPTAEPRSPVNPSAAPSLDLSAIQGLLTGLLHSASGTSAVPSLGSLGNVGSLADLARLAQSANVPVHITPHRDHRGHTAYDVQTPYGNFRVSTGDEDNAQAPAPPAPSASADAPTGSQPWTGSF